MSKGKIDRRKLEDDARRFAEAVTQLGMMFERFYERGNPHLKWKDENGTAVLYVTHGDLSVPTGIKDGDDDCPEGRVSDWWLFWISFGVSLLEEKLVKVRRKQSAAGKSRRSAGRPGKKPAVRKKAGAR